MEAGSDLMSRRPAAGQAADDRPVAEMRAGRIAVAWALIGLALTFAVAVFRLAERGVATIRGGLEPGEWIGLIVLTVLFIYGEGVRGLQRRWIPAVLRRVGELRTERRWPIRLLAPLYAMLLVGAPRRTLWRAWLGVAAIVAAVFIVRALPEPWRGMTDFAVACALGWGLLVILAGAWRIAAGPSPARRAE